MIQRDGRSRERGAVGHAILPATGPALMCCVAGPGVIRLGFFLAAVRAMRGVAPADERQKAVGTAGFVKNTLKALFVHVGQHRHNREQWESRFALLDGRVRNINVRRLRFTRVFGEDARADQRAKDAAHGREIDGRRVLRLRGGDIRSVIVDARSGNQMEREAMAMCPIEKTPCIPSVSLRVPGLNFAWLKNAR